MVANKIELNGETILDLSEDNVTTEDVKEGVKFHLPNGHSATGTMTSFGTGVYVGSETPPAEAFVWIDLNGDPSNTEEWEFEMQDGTSVTKVVVVTEGAK